jgi:cytochrome o ubiquinol oxidase operon protein cyoD
MSHSKYMNRDAGYRLGRRGYVTGFLFAAVLTIVPFLLVASGALSTVGLLWVIGILGLIQVVVHIRYFLHVDLSPERREELYLLLFSGALLVLMVAGMLWILFNMHDRMM